jgi:hypothetical protein
MLVQDSARLSIKALTTPDDTPADRASCAGLIGCEALSRTRNRAGVMREGVTPDAMTRTGGTQRHVENLGDRLQRPVAAGRVPQSHDDAGDHPRTQGHGDDLAQRQIHPFGLRIIERLRQRSGDENLSDAGHPAFLAEFHGALQVPVNRKGV